jgi:hypothetical protein
MSETAKVSESCVWRLPRGALAAVEAAFEIAP